MLLSLTKNSNRGSGLKQFNNNTSQHIPLSHISLKRIKYIITIQLCSLLLFDSNLSTLIYRSSVAICTPALPTTGIITNMGKTTRSLELQLAAISTYTAEGDRVKVFKCIRDIRTEVQSTSTETCSALEQLIRDVRIITKRHDAMQYLVALLESQKKHFQEEF